MVIIIITMLMIMKTIKIMTGHSIYKDVSYLLITMTTARQVGPRLKNIEQGSRLAKRRTGKKSKE